MAHGPHEGRTVATLTSHRKSLDEIMLLTLFLQIALSLASLSLSRTTKSASQSSYGLYGHWCEVVTLR